MRDDLISKPCPFCGNKAAPQIMDQNQALWSNPEHEYKKTLKKRGLIAQEHIHDNPELLEGEHNG